jgi:hypothetical protein
MTMHVDIMYICYRYIRVLEIYSSLIMVFIKTKINLSRALVTLVNFGYSD